MTSDHIVTSKVSCLTHTEMNIYICDSFIIGLSSADIRMKQQKLKRQKKFCLDSSRTSLSGFRNDHERFYYSAFLINHAVVSAKISNGESLKV